MDNLDEFFARKDRRKGSKKFTRADEMVQRLLQKKMEAEDAYRRQQESNAALLAFENQNQEMMEGTSSTDMDLTGLRLANSSTAAEGLLNRQGRRVHWWPPSENDMPPPTDVQVTAMEVDDANCGNKDTTLHLRSQRSFPTLTDKALTPKTASETRSEGGDITTTTNDDTPGFRLDFRMADDEDEDQDPDKGSTLTFSSRCDSFEGDGNEADSEL